MTLVSLAHLVDNVLSADWLSDLIGDQVQASRIRIKPKTSVIAAITRRDSAVPVGWVRFLWPVSHNKADLTQSAAARLGLATTQRKLSGELLMQSGEVLADPRLMDRLKTASSSGWVGPWRPELVLRYNPARRVVVREGSWVVRIAAKKHPLGVDFDHFLAGVIECPTRLDDGSQPGLSAHSFTGEGDLDNHPSTSATTAAGMMLARLHAADKVPAQLVSILDGRASDPVRQGVAHAKLLDELAPELAGRVRRLISRIHPLTSSSLVLSHGDFSPDQVLVAENGSQVWLTDFDRACLTPSAIDLGSFLAVTDDDTGRAFLDGYRHGGGSLPPEKDLQEAIAGSLMSRIADPLRHASPEWRSEVSANLDRIAEVLI